MHWRVHPNIAISNPGRGIFKPLQLRIIRKPGVTEEFTYLLVLPGNACSRLIKVPLQGFGKIPAAMCGSFPAGPPNTPPGFDMFFFATGGFIDTPGVNSLASSNVSC